jgi:hypothetical protein
MSRKLLALLLSELDDVRIICQSCKTAVEINIDLLDKENARPMKCSGCGRDFRKKMSPSGVHTTDPFDDLAAAIRGLKALTNLECEFIVQEKDAKE